MQKYVNLVDLVRSFSTSIQYFPCKIRRRYSRERVSESFEAVFYSSFQSTKKEKKRKKKTPQASPVDPSPAPPEDQEGGGIASGVVDIVVDRVVADLAEPIVIRLPNSGNAEVSQFGLTLS